MYPSISGWDTALDADKTPTREEQSNRLSPMMSWRRYYPERDGALPNCRGSANT